MATNNYGWELLYKIYEQDINNKEDVLVLFVHWCLTKYGFRCIGIGSGTTFDETVVGNELLPDGWNRTTVVGSDGVSLRYVLGGKLFILRCFNTDQQFIFNLLRMHDYTVSSLLYKSDDVIGATRGTLAEMVPTREVLRRSVLNSLIAPLHSGVKRNVESQTVAEAQPAVAPTSRRTEPVWDQRPDHVWDPNARPASIDTIPGFQRDLRAVGRNDLDPLTGIGHGGRGMSVGGGGGGMLFNPLGNRGGIRDPGAGIPGGLPRGSVPPGARFDPFGPPAPGRPGPSGGPRFGAPDPDHMPPPGYDDMFM